ncbi:hypothetical protein LSAT2_009045, partial [Lamellibrachia satsuma]
MRWRLFRQILRIDEEAPANEAKSAYFQTDGLEGYRGRPRTGLPGTLDADLPHIGIRLKTRADLQQLRRIAKNKTEWKTLHRTTIEGNVTVGQAAIFLATLILTSAAAGLDSVCEGTGATRTTRGFGAAVDKNCTLNRSESTHKSLVAMGIKEEENFPRDGPVAVATKRHVRVMEQPELFK